MEFDPPDGAAISTPVRSVSWGGVATPSPAVGTPVHSANYSTNHRFGQQYAALQSPGTGQSDNKAMTGMMTPGRHPPTQPGHSPFLAPIPHGQPQPQPFQRRQQPGLTGTGAPLQQSLFGLNPFHTPSPAKGVGFSVGGDPASDITPLPATPVRRPAAKRQCPFDDTTPLQMKHQIWDRPTPAATHASTFHRLMAAQREELQPDEDGDEELAAMEGAAADRCSICNSQQPSEPCSFCGKSSCGSCTRECVSCQDTFCSYCSTTNYDLRYDRNFCLECNEEESKESSSPQSVMYSPAKRQQQQQQRHIGGMGSTAAAQSSATRTLFAFAPQGQ